MRHKWRDGKIQAKGNNVSIITDGIFWILIVTGLMTLTMAGAVIAPGMTFRNTFGEALAQDPAHRLLMRAWGWMVTLLGIALVVAAYEEAARFWVLCYASASKLGFAAMVLTLDTQGRHRKVYLVAFADIVMALLYVAYLTAAT